VAQIASEDIPFEVKYKGRVTEERDVKGMVQFSQEKKCNRGYIITKDSKDFGLLNQDSKDSINIFRVSAALLCYWMGQMEISST
jgi:hypothetical protein